MKSAQKFGIISGLFSGLWMIAEFYLGLHDRPEGKYTEYLGLMVFTVCIVLSIFYTRERDMNGAITFKLAWRSGIITVVISALITSLFCFIFCKWLNPDWILKQLPTPKPEDIKKAKSIGGLIQMCFFLSAATTLMGTFLAALFSVLMRKEKAL